MHGSVDTPMRLQAPEVIDWPNPRGVHSLVIYIGVRIIFESWHMYPGVSMSNDDIQ